VLLPEERNGDAMGGRENPHRKPIVFPCFFSMFFSNEMGSSSVNVPYSDPLKYRPHGSKPMGTWDKQLNPVFVWL
jgi:hypothetical protein